MTAPYRARSQYHAEETPSEASKRSRGKAPSGVNFLFDFAHKKWAEPQ